MDNVDKATRSYIMSKVGQKNTGAEMLMRTALHKIGLRYRLHDRSLPGSPDLVFPRYSAVVFVHGCYWHSHGCYRSTVPESRREFWTEKFRANRSRDERNLGALLERGWRVLTIWECALRGKTAKSSSVVGKTVKAWLESSDNLEEIVGSQGVASSRERCEQRCR
jgi:DNA mismatch endonuclease (patch repair protein)